MLLVDGDPLADLQALSRVRLVIRDGHMAANSRG
jgi:imidazolonepropionase-like amidohydrolase